MAVNKLCSLRSKGPNYPIENDIFKDLLSQVQFWQNAQIFANFWYQKPTLQSSHSTKWSIWIFWIYIKPPATKQFSYEEINELRLRPSKLDHPCHNQAVEWHVKLVSGHWVVCFDYRSWEVWWDDQANNLIHETNEFFRNKETIQCLKTSMSVFDIAEYVF